MIKAVHGAIRTESSLPCTPDQPCLHCQSQNGKIKHINHGAYKPHHALADGEVNRVSLPGDKDYTEQAVERDGQ
jgi:hypothetical protein